ncbi:hypothetical protein HCG46_26185 [Labrenzia sp. PO1]|uniref:hypothetical protein n=1 Tax=Labrenzia sp. PO1 TaxID=2720390 RepID=UPI0014450D20|nr:hypothetical protein [Labrenzia sp. PO1]NKI61791.1 hypothetical protein [Labrenzia sp. PO1]
MKENAYHAFSGEEMELFLVNLEPVVFLLINGLGANTCPAFERPNMLPVFISVSPFNLKGDFLSWNINVVFLICESNTESYGSASVADWCPWNNVNKTHSAALFKQIAKRFSELIILDNVFFSWIVTAILKEAKEYIVWLCYPDTENCNVSSIVVPKSKNFPVVRLSFPVVIKYREQITRNDSCLRFKDFVAFSGSGERLFQNKQRNYSCTSSSPTTQCSDPRPVAFKNALIGFTRRVEGACGVEHCDRQKQANGEKSADQDPVVRLHMTAFNTHKLTLGVLA